MFLKEQEPPKLNELFFALMNSSAIVDVQLCLWVTG